LPVWEVLLEIFACYQRQAADSPYGMIQAMFGDWQDGLRSAAEDAGFRVVHMSTALLADDGAPRYDAYEITSDGLHFNAAGHRILADQCLLEDGLPE